MPVSGAFRRGESVHSRELPQPDCMMLSCFFTYWPMSSFRPAYRWYQSKGSGSLHRSTFEVPSTRNATAAPRHLAPLPSTHFVYRWSQYTD